MNAREHAEMAATLTDSAQINCDTGDATVARDLAHIAQAHALTSIALTLHTKAEHDIRAALIVEEVG